MEKTGVPVGQIIEFDCLDGKVLDPKYKDNLDPDGNGLYGLLCLPDGTFSSFPQFPAENHCVEYPVCASMPRSEEWEDFGYAMPAGALDDYDDNDAPIYITKVMPGNSLWLTCADPTAIFDNGAGKLIEFKC